MMEEIGFKFMEDIIWVKPEGGLFSTERVTLFHSTEDLILISQT